MVETNYTCIKTMEPRKIFIHPTEYEVIEGMLEGYVKVVLESERDPISPRWNAFKEKLSEVRE